MRGREGKERQREKHKRGSLGGKQKCLWSWQTDVEEKLSCMCKGPPELAGSHAQMALCSKPSTNEKIERWKRRGGTLAGATRGGEDFFLGWGGSAGTDSGLLVLITSHLQFSGILSGQHESKTCDLEMMSLTANHSDVQQYSAVLHIHYTMPCINRSMVMRAFLWIQTTVVCDTSITLQNNQTAWLSPGSVNTVDVGKVDDTAGVFCLHPLWWVTVWECV